MKKQQIYGFLALVLITAAAAAAAGRPQAPDQCPTPSGEEAAYVELLSATPLAELEGETLSPNGRFQVRTLGASDIYVSGVRVPERLQIVDTRTGEVKWEDQGYVWQSVLWSPVNDFVALAYGGRTWQTVTVISTAYWTSWDFTLPDGGPIPEYTFLPEDWGEWLDTNTLLVTSDGGDGVGEHTYRCVVSTNSQTEELSGSTLEQTKETLPGDYDFDHDGEPETVELVTVLTPETPYFPAWYELNVIKADGTALWTQDAGLPHVGWISIFACEIGGRDYLLRYLPWAGQGYYAYDYQLFSLDSAGEELTLLENQVGFDMMFGSGMHQRFEPAAIAAFLEEVHGYLDGSALLITTEHGNFRTGGSGADFREDMDFWGDDCPYDANKSLEENLRNLEQFRKQEHGIE